LNNVLKLFAPFIPHITEEIFATIFAEEFAEFDSINARGIWPKAENITLNQEALEIGEEALKIIALVRKYKSEQNISMKVEIEKLQLNSKFNLEKIKEDLANVCNAKEVIFSEKISDLVKIS
jgi:valyl-tRNA synthetase